MATKFGLMASSVFNEDENKKKEDNSSSFKNYFTSYSNYMNKASSEPEKSEVLAPKIEPVKPMTSTTLNNSAVSLTDTADKNKYGNVNIRSLSDETPKAQTNSKAPTVTQYDYSSQRPSLSELQSSSKDFTAAKAPTVTQYDYSNQRPSIDEVREATGEPLVIDRALSAFGAAASNALRIVPQTISVMNEANPFPETADHRTKMLEEEYAKAVRMGASQDVLNQIKGFIDEREASADTDMVITKALSDYLGNKEAEFRASATEGLEGGALFAAELGLSATDLLTKGAASAVTGVPFLAFAGADSGADAAEQALDEGKTVGEVWAMGLGSGAITASIESLTGIGGNNAAKLFDKLAETPLGKELVSKFTGETFKALGKVLSNNIVKNAAGEAVEEFTEYYAQNVYEAVVKDEEIDTDVKEALLSALAGGIIGGVFGAGRSFADVFRDSSAQGESTVDVEVDNEVDNLIDSDVNNNVNNVENSFISEFNATLQGGEQGENKTISYDDKSVNSTSSAQGDISATDTQSTQSELTDNTNLLNELNALALDTNDNAIETTTFDEGSAKAANRQNYIENQLVKRVINAIKYEDGAEVVTAGGTELRNDLKSLIRDVTNEVFTTGKVNRDLRKQIEKAVIDNATIKIVEDYNRTKPVRDYLKDTLIFVPDRVKADFADWPQFLRSNFGKLNIRNAGKTNIDKLYMEMLELFPGEFDGSITNPPEQLRAISEYLSNNSIRYNDYSEVSEADYVKTGLSDVLDKMDYAFKSYISEMNKVVRYEKDYSDTMKQRRAKNEAVLKEVTDEEAIRLGIVKEFLQKDYDKLMRTTMLTRADKNIIDALVNGTITLESEFDKTNFAEIKKVYELKKQINDIKDVIAPRRTAIADAYRAQVEEVMSDVNLSEVKNVTSGALLGLRSVPKTIEYIFGQNDEGNKINETFIRPLIAADAQVIREHDRFFKPIADYIKENNFTEREDILANQYNLYRQELENLAEVETNQALQQVSEYNKNIEDMKLELGEERFEKVKTLSEMIWKQFPELIKMQNKALVQNGFDPKAPRKSYYPITYNKSSNDWMNKITELMGGKATSELPTDIAGRTGDFKPNKTWNRFLLERTDSGLGDFDQTARASEVFSSYLSSAMDTTYKAEGIRKMRALTDYIRYTESAAGLKEQIQAIRNNPDISPEDADRQIAEIYGQDVGHLGQTVTWLENYTNTQANKKDIVDRGIEHMMGRGVYAMSNSIQNRVAANMIAGNLSSVASQMLVLAPASAELGVFNLQKALFQTINSKLGGESADTRAEFENNDYLTGRMGKISAPQYGPVNRALEVASKPFTDVDVIIAETITRGFMNKGLPLEQASREAGRIMADRSKAARATIFNTQNPFMRPFLMFQTENLNQYLNAYDVAKTKYNQDGLIAAARYAFSYMVSSYLMNELWEKLFGRRPLPDPIGTAVSGFETAGREGVAKAGLEVGGDIVENIPFVGGLLGGGRIPVSSAIPDFASLWSDTVGYLSGDVSAGAAGETAFKELIKPVTYLALPGGGGQIKKTAEGLYQFGIGGSYSTNNAGERQLQYPTAGTPLEFAQMALLGRSSTANANEYWDEYGGAPLSANETSVVDASEAVGLSKEATYDIIRELRSVDKTDELSKRENQRQTLFEMENLSPSQKSWIDRNLWEADTGRLMNYTDPLLFEISMLGKDEYLSYQTLSRGGVTAQAYLDSYNAVKDIQPDTNLLSMPIPNSEYHKEKAAIDKASRGLSDSAQLKLYQEFGLISDTVVEEANYFKSVGVPTSVYMDIYSAEKDIESDKDAEGKTIPNSKGRKIKALIDSTLPQDTSWEVRVKMYEDFNVGKSLYS